MKTSWIAHISLSWLCAHGAFAQASDDIDGQTNEPESYADPCSASPAPEEGVVPFPVSTNLGEVTFVEGTSATISLGAADGVTLDAHIAFLEPDTGGEWKTDGPTIVGEVVNLGEHEARVSLGVLEDVKVGDKVQVTRAKLTASRFAPGRTPAQWLITAGLRPFLPLARVSIGAAANLALTYLPELPVFITAELDPLAGRIGKGPDSGSAAASVTLGYEQRLVSIGLGVGAASYRRYLLNDDDDWADRGYLGRAVPRFTFGQQLRVGARDGVHLQLASAFALVGESWRLASLRVTGQFRLRTGLWVSPRLLAAPQMGLFSLEAGLRVLVRGNGGVGSVFVRPAVGATGTYDARENEDLRQTAAGLQTMLFGPMIGVDVEFRL